MRTLIGTLLLFASILPATAAAGGPELTFELDGYYRVRAHLFGNLFDREFPKDGARDVPLYYLQDANTDIPAEFADQFRTQFPSSTTSQLVDSYCRSFPAQCRKAIHAPQRSSWLVQRGRFEPRLKMRGITVQATIDVFDNVVWGDNENLAATPLFANNPSNTQINGNIADSIQVKRLWAEWQTAFGLLRIGRQPSHWGLGILANDGDEFRNDFGDAYEGNVFDRIIFATRPVTLIKGIHAIATGKEMPDAADDPGIITAVGYDKLVNSGAVPFRRQITGDESISDENAEGTAGIRQSPIWLSDSGDDVHEMIYVLMFKREDWQVGRELMDLTVGTYWINRWQNTTESNVWIPDIYVRWAMRGAFVEAEWYHIFGSTEAIAPDFDKTTTAGITGFVARAGYENPIFTGLFEVGYASGDDSILDENFTGRPLHSDFNVGLILYEQLLAQRTIEKFVGDEDTQGLWSQGGVYNSTYINPRFKFRPGDIWEFRLGFLMAWANEVDGAIIPYLRDESAGNITESKLLGTEIDFGIHMKWLNEHILVGIEGGFMRAGERLGRTTQYQDPAQAVGYLPYNEQQYDEITNRLNNVFTVQGRFAFVF
tara:strand:- start:1152 stop:2948 length:1797 start_codon:yes stop_codon:yes gene_type:complete